MNDLATYELAKLRQADLIAAANNSRVSRARRRRYHRHAGRPTARRKLAGALHRLADRIEPTTRRARLVMPTQRHLAR
jgi:hypothetical protein